MALQGRGVESMVLIADYQVITDRDSVGTIRATTLWLLADYLAAGFTGLDPDILAADLRSGGGRALKQLVTESVNEGLRSHRQRRADFAADPAHLLDVLRAGNAAANLIAETTLTEVRRAMSMDY